MIKETKNTKEILKELLLTEEDTLAKSKSLIDKTKAIIKIDQKSGKILISSDNDFSNAEKVLLFLIGRYFSKELGICDKEGLDVQELETTTGIKRTTLSKPLGGLVYSGYVGKDNEKKYFVHHYKIESIVNLLHDKYVEKKSNAKSLNLKYKSPGKRKKGGKDG